MNPFTEEQIELQQCIKSALAGNGRFNVNLKTRMIINELKERREISTYSRNDLEHVIFLYCVKSRSGGKSILDRYDSNKASLQTYVNNIVIKFLCNMQRKIREPVTEVYDTVLDGIETESASEDSYATTSIIEYDLYHYSTITPEDLVIMKDEVEREQDTFLRFHNKEITAKEGARRLNMNIRTFYRKYKKLKKHMNDFNKIEDS